MTDEEQNLLLAGLVRERRELRLKIRCLEEKLRNSQAAFRTAVRLTESADQGQRSREPLSPYLPHEELMEVLDTLDAVRKRRAQIEEILDE